MSPSASRLSYLDHLRVLLTCLVVLVHVAITYGAAGDWYYTEPSTSAFATLVLTIFTATCQGFFMGCFFLLAAYFTPASLARKGPRHFLTDRGLRLGLPLLFYLLVLNPLVVALVHVHKVGGSYLELFRHHYPDQLGLGPMWYVLNLLLFTLVFVGVQHFRQAPLRPGPAPGPSLAATLLVAAALGLASFLVRLAYPPGYWLPLFHLMPAYQPQYLAFFAVGLLAGERGWQGDLSPRLVRFWSLAAPLALATSLAWIALAHPLDLSAPGGLNWRSFVFAICEQAFAVGFTIILLHWFRRRCNCQSLLGAAAADCYPVYIIHPLILVLLGLGLANLALPSLAKFLLVAPLALAACFASAHLLRQLPLARKIL